MPRFDENTRQIVVRVVYDGAGTAGKTTNLEQLTELLTRSRRGELIAKETTRGRTLFFEWLQLEGGLIGGYKFRCELLTVPGQTTLRRRRKRLLEAADVVVLVVDSTPDGVSEGARMFEQLRKYLADRDVPIIVQANKQDLPDAMSTEALRKRLALPEEIPVVPAEAARGAGVRDTALLAMRQAAVTLHGQVVERGVSLFPPVEETPESLHAEMRLLRIEATPSDMVGSDRPPGPELLAELEASGHTGGPSAEPQLTSRAPKAPSLPASLHPAQEHVVTVVPGRDEAEPPTRAHVVERIPSGPLAGDAEPPRPNPEATSRHIWPAAAGRDLLRRLASDKLVLCPELMHKQGKNDGSGKPDTLVYRAGQHCLKTSPRRRYEGVEDGERALVDLARAKVALGGLLLPSTVLQLQEDDEGGYWLWTICPWSPSLRSDMEAAERVHSSAALGVALRRYVDASFAALSLLRDKQLVLDVNPSNFAALAGQVGYLDDDIGAGQQMPSLGYAWLKRVDEYASAFDAVERYVVALEEGIKQQLGAADVARWDLITMIEQTLVSTDAGRDAKLRLSAAARRCT